MITNYWSSYGRQVLGRAFPPASVDIDGDGESDYKVPRHPMIYYAKNLLPSFVLMMTVQLLS